MWTCLFLSLWRNCHRGSKSWWINLDYGSPKEATAPRSAGKREEQTKTVQQWHVKKSHLSTLTSADAFLSGAAVEEDKAKSSCAFCEGSHPFDSCKMFLLVDERPDILCRHRRFFKCLKVPLLETALLAMWWEPLRGSLQVSGNTSAASDSYWHRGIERGRK